MSVRVRWILTVVTAGLWVAWMWCAIIHKGDGPLPIASEGIRTLFIVSALSLVLGCLVTPMVTALHVGRQIGQAERRRQCSCGDDDEARPHGQVVAFKPTRRT